MTTQAPSPLLTPRPSELSHDAFVAHYGGIFEHSPWVADAAWQAGLSAAHDTPSALADHMGDILKRAPEAKQIAVIRAHPDLAGKAAMRGELTADSTQEQAGAGLDQCSPEEFARFERLNDAYTEKFSFPFVIAVKGLDRHDILQAFDTRIDNDLATERRTAIEQIIRIAHLRLQARACD